MTPEFWLALSRAIQTTDRSEHFDRLLDVIGEAVPHDLITVTRYSATAKPEFVRHRSYSDRMVKRYLETYYTFDPFYGYWRNEQLVGVVPLRAMANDEAKRGRYFAEFLAQSDICDEVGILLPDGGDWCLGIFLDRTESQFKDIEIRQLEKLFDVFASLHEQNLSYKKKPDPAKIQPGALPSGEPDIPATFWPELSIRERELVQLILSGHPTAVIAQRMGIAGGTVKNHRARIYSKLDITTERELFLQFFLQGQGQVK